MVLSVRTFKLRKSDYQPIYKTYRYANFDTDSSLGKSFEEKFNEAFYILRDEIEDDKENNDMNLYTEIKITDVWLS